MEWILDLVGVTCSFCGIDGAAQFTESGVCFTCAERAAKLETIPPPLLSVVDGNDLIPLISLTAYEDWWRDVIIQNKQNPSPVFIRWATAFFLKSLPRTWREAQLVWIPGRSWTAPHLVDHLAHELRPFFKDPTPRPPLARRVNLGIRPQHLLRRKERMAQKTAFRLPPNSGFNSARPVVLLDDVCTTGSTLISAAKLLAPARILGAITLAVTPRRL